MSKRDVRSLLIRNGRLLDPSQNLDETSDLLLKEGKVEAIGGKLDSALSESVDQIDASGLVVTPGWIDIHTHLRDPGYSHKETIGTGGESAAAGGFTSIVCMANTNPVNDNPFVTSYIYQKAKEDSPINVYAIGAITQGLKGERLADIGSMREAGIVGISDDGETVMNAYVMRKALDYSKRFDLVVISHAEDTNLRSQGVMNEGFNSTQFGLRGNPKAAEEIMVARDIILAELTGGRLHVAHVSCGRSVRMIREAKERGIAVTCEVTPHHLCLTDDAVGNYDTNTKVAPPLREPEDVAALQEALRDGTIDALATDHAPHSVTEKETEYDLAAFGMVGLEIALPIYSEACKKADIPLSRMIETMTHRPAAIVGIPKGTLTKGSDADVTIFNPSAKHQILASQFRSKSQNTPFDGRDVEGRVEYTICAGEVVFQQEDPKK